MNTAGRQFESNFWSGVLTIFSSQLLVKLLGLAYRLVITNIDGFGDIGNGYYNAGFQIYTLLLSLSSVGIPSAISKLAAQAEAAGNHRRSEEIFRTAMALFFGIGLLCAGILYLSADVLARFVIRMEGVQGTLRALSPAVLFVCLSSVLRGYYLGLGSAKTAGSSQVVEQLLKSVLTVVIVLALAGCSAQMMSAGANFATSIAAGGSFAYLIVGHIRYQAGRPGLNRRRPRQSFFKLSKTILLGKVSAPAKALFWGILVKITLNFLLVRIPVVNIYGAPVASAVCYLTSFVLEYRWLKQIIPIRRSFSRFVRRVFLCAGGMGLAARRGCPVLQFLLPSNALALLITIAGSAILYFSLLLISDPRFEFGAVRHPKHSILFFIGVLLIGYRKCNLQVRNSFTRVFPRHKDHD